MHNVTLHGLTFRPFISAAELAKDVARVAGEIDARYQGRRPLILVVLNGAFVFAADLVRQLTCQPEVAFTKLSSYAGTQSTGQIEVCLAPPDVKGRDVVVVEDIVETGLTMQHLVRQLTELGAKSVSICSLFVKPHRLEGRLEVDFRGRDIGDDFIVGYGLDYDSLGRNLKDIWVVGD